MCVFVLLLNILNPHPNLPGNPRHNQAGRFGMEWEGLGMGLVWKVGRFQPIRMALPTTRKSGSHKVIRTKGNEKWVRLFLFFSRSSFCLSSHSSNLYSPHSVFSKTTLCRPISGLSSFLVREFVVSFFRDQVSSSLSFAPLLLLSKGV